MKCTTSVSMMFLLVYVAAVNIVDSASDTHPIESTIELLKELKDKVKEGGQAEEVTYAKFETWCSNSIKSLKSAIAAGQEEVDTLTSTVASKTEKHEELSTDIVALTSELQKLSAADTEADNQRAKTTSLYETSDQDLAATIQALGDAITALEAAQSSTSTFAQVEAKLQHLMAYPLLLERLGDAGVESLFSSQPIQFHSAPAPAPKYDDLFAKGDSANHTKKYTFKSNNVVELLKDLKTKFEDDRLENTKAETNSQNAHSLAKNARASATQAAADAQEEKTTLLGDVQSALATAKGDLANRQDDLKADHENLADTKKSCDMKKSEWTERSEIREHEIKAMEEAIKILAEVGGVRTEAPTNPVLPPSPLAFATVAVSPKTTGTPTLLQSPDPNMMKAINLLREEARAIHSRSLEQFAEEVKAHLGGPFDEVNNMIQKMIFRLMAEQKDEDDHKNWCELELSKYNISKHKKSDRITALSLEVDNGKAKAEQLTNQVKTASDKIAELTAHMAEAADIRAAGKAENRLAIEDAKAGQLAIAKATAVLEAHYKETGMMKKEAWEFIESAAGEPQVLPAEPSTWSSAYVGVTDPNAQPGGVITLLKTVSADFARMEADTTAQEEVDQKAYDEQMKSCTIEKARLSKEVEMREQERTRLLAKVNDEEKSLKHTQDQLEKLEQYLKDLGPACLEGDSTYEQRKAARAAEVSALKEAQVILAGAFDSPAAAPAPAAAALVASAPKHVPIQQLRR